MGAGRVGRRAQTPECRKRRPVFCRASIFSCRASIARSPWSHHEHLFPEASEPDFEREQEQMPSGQGTHGSLRPGGNFGARFLWRWWDDHAATSAARNGCLRSDRARSGMQHPVLWRDTSSIPSARSCELSSGHKRPGDRSARIRRVGSDVPGQKPIKRQGGCGRVCHRVPVRAAFAGGGNHGVERVLQ
jgi:hypothetical protein